ncbi:MAG: hypothetical protein ABMA14_05150 [Hyphomonadaceae bacterium]
MLRVCLGLTGLLLVSACASTPKGPADQILGAWDCHAASEGSVVDGRITYMTGGLATGDTAMAIDAGSMKVKLKGALNATWGFQPDGKLIETVTGLKVTSAEMDGKTIPAPAIGAMVQPMVDQMAVGQTSTSTVVFDGATMTSTDDKGVVTTCKR